MEAASVCRHCGKAVSAANLLVHEARCPRLPAPAPASASGAATASNGAPRSNESSGRSSGAVHRQAAGAGSIVGATTISNSNSNSYDNGATMVMNPSFEDAENAEAEDAWACRACTYLNSVARSTCDACGTRRGETVPFGQDEAEEVVRTPDATYTDCLISDNMYGPRSSVPPPSRPQRGTSFNSLLAGAAMGALGGGLLSYFRGGSMADGVISGAGYGALTSALLNELNGGPGPDEVFRGRPTAGPSSFTRTVVTPTGRHTVRVFNGRSGRGATDGMPPEIFDDFMFPFNNRMISPQQQLEMMFLRSLAMQHGHSGDVDNMSYEELLRRFGDRRPQPAARRDIDALPTRTFTEADVQRTRQQEGDSAGTSSGGDDRTSCLVCLENFNVGENVKTLPCLHMFHTSCIDEWLANSGVCPVCKMRVDEDQPPSDTA